MNTFQMGGTMILSICLSLSALGYEKETEEIPLPQRVQQTLKKWSKTPDENAEIAARELLLLHEELQTSTELSAKAQKILTQSVQRKLKGLSRQISSQAPSQVTLPEGVSEVLGQWNSGNDSLSQRQDELAQIGGEQLVEVIQKTIRPDSWEENGGHGTIYYWNNHRVLIIRQTQQIHGEVGGVLRQLRR
ncbi:MAG: hypothetical protein Q4D62_13770 [Planctomycetia bacterium]|nr:hypothetical protein [Planctomycetia bacterium]